MLSRWRRGGVTALPDPKSVNYTSEHVALAKTITRRRHVVAAVSNRVPILR